MALALTGVGCGGDGDQASETELTVEQVMDFVSDYHAEDPFVVAGAGEPLTDCNWTTDPQETEAYSEAAVALFHCTGGTDDEDGEYPVYVEEYEDEAAARAGIDDRLLATGEILFVAGTTVVDGEAIDQERKLYEALIAECSCGEVVEI